MHAGHVKPQHNDDKSSLKGAYQGHVTNIISWQPSDISGMAKARA